MLLIYMDIHMVKLERLRQLYASIPSSKCADGCHACCHDLIQMSPEERDNMGGYEFTDSCIHLVNGHCEVYERRPLVCRLYGSSELLRCVDCEAEGMLSEADTKKILLIYKELIN